jgi:tight adherence protein B
MPLQVLVGLVFIVSTAVLMGVFFLVSRRSQSTQSKTLEKRLSEATGIGPMPADLAGASLLRQESTSNIDRVARQAIKGSALERWIEQSGTGISVSTCVLTSFALGAVLAVLAMTFVGRSWAMLLGFLLGMCILPLVLRQKRSARLYKFEEVFPEALDLLSRGIRAGHAFTAGMKMVADELGEPVGPEFRKAFDEQNFGLPLKESLNNLCLRVPNLDVRFFSTAVLIQRETGGNLSEILDNLAGVVRERFKIRRQVRVHTAHGRFTAYVLMALPAFLAFALSFINPEHMNRLFEDKLGQMMIVGTIIMQAIGFFWIKQVIKIEV